METRYVVVLGSLMSGLGKGLITASTAKLLSFYNYNAMPLKFDGYLNYDCGTMNPFRHGEVFVLDDGGEVDMDFGNYERFINRPISSKFSITGGKVFSEIIAKERKGEFLGNDVQIIPHLTDSIIAKIEWIAKSEKLDVMIIEVGGTIGDIENNYFVEAMRQLAMRHKTVFIDVTLIPELEKVGEQKTKPAQIGLRNLMQEGIRPDFVMCRSKKKLMQKTREKLALFSNLPQARILDDNDIDNLYQMPSILMEQKFDKMLLQELGLTSRKINKKKISSWNSNIGDGHKKTAKISIVGKYVDLRDSYASVKEAIIHAGFANKAKIDINWVDSEVLEHKDAAEILNGSDGILVPGGFGKRGTEGMIKAIEYARTKKIPYLGLCFGMQLMCIEYARNICGIKDANSMEFKKTKHNVIDIMPNQKDVKQLGGTMRLGAWKARVKPGTLAYRIYNSKEISERHRHRYEVNNKYRKLLEKNGLVISATTPDNRLVEVVEWKNQFGIATQAHPELKSTPESPAPLFVAFIESAVHKA